MIIEILQHKKAAELPDGKAAFLFRGVSCRFGSAVDKLISAKILETYLNHVYFGSGIYGVEAASQRFWGKNASQLTLANLYIGCYYS